ncbi:nucleotidyltransferase [Nanoarchaeota archaeon]
MSEQTKTIDKEILNKIKQIILDTANTYNIKIHKIILFGSRARGDYREYSDWDILIVTEDKLDKELEDNFYLEVGRKLVKLNIIPEIIISAKEEFEKYKYLKGFIYYWADKEGIIL